MSPRATFFRVDEGTAEAYADVRDELKRSGRPIPGNDLWIAALARQHALPLLSRDRHFDFVPGIKRVGCEKGWGSCRPKAFSTTGSLRAEHIGEQAPGAGNACGQLAKPGVRGKDVDALTVAGPQLASFERRLVRVVA